MTTAGWVCAAEGYPPGWRTICWAKLAALLKRLKTGLNGVGGVAVGVVFVTIFAVEQDGHLTIRAPEGTPKTVLYGTASLRGA